MTIFEWRLALNASDEVFHAYDPSDHRLCSPVMGLAASVRPMGADERACAECAQLVVDRFHEIAADVVALLERGER